jgi:hypothetical protein
MMAAALGLPEANQLFARARKLIRR